MKPHDLLAATAFCLAVLGPATASAGIRYWDNPAYRAFDVDCYAPGVFWNYDGIRNAGATSAHDSAATTWRNLGTGGSTYDLTEVQSLQNGDKGHWNDADGYVFAGNSRFRRPGQSVTVDGSWTVQMLVDAKASDQTSSSGGAYVMSLMWNYFAFAIGPEGTAPAGAFLANVQGANGSATPIRPYFVPASGSFDYATAILDSEARTVAIFDGTTPPTAAPGLQTIPTLVASRSDSGYGVGGRTGSQNLVGTLKSFRWYKRVLDADELAWNRVVDERRFFDRAAPLPMTNAVVATAVAGLEGAEPSGCYAVDENGHVFTAPRIAESDGRKYLCTGHTLETWDAETGDWGAPVFHARELSRTATDTSRIRITWQWTDAEGLATYDVSDYVWDGLEVFYDGILNQGTNAAHSTTAVTWVNIGNGSKGASNNLKLQRYTGSAWADATSVEAVGGYDPGEWTDNGFTFAGQGRFRCDSPGGFTVGTSYSLQMLIDAKASEQISGAGVTTHAYPFAVNNKTFGFDIRRTDNNLYWCVLSDESDYSNYPFLSGGSYDYFTAIMDGSNNKQSFFSGTDIPGSGSGVKNKTAAGFSDTGFALGGYGKTAVTERFVGTIKSFRQYDHALTPAEVAQNRKVDDFRYFGTFAETDVIVQSTYPALRGNEPDGGYDLNGSHTFSAPAIVSVKVHGKTVTYACAGYTVESQDGIAWAVAQRGDGNSVAIAEGGGVKRLTWLWRPVSGLRTAADYSFADYSQAGLVWNYDGLYNAGIGVHDSTATTWKNLGSGTNADLHWNGATSTGHWADDGYVFAGGPRFKGNATFRMRNCTMQTLVDGTPADQTATTGDFAFAFNGSQNYFNFRIVRASYNGSAANSFCWVAQNNMYMYFHAPNNRYSFATAIQDFDNKKAMMFPGTEIPTEYVKDGLHGAQRLYHEFGSMSAVNDTGYGLGNLNNGTAGFVGTVRSFRYYDRVLTEDELVRNRNADAARYFGALGVTNLVVEVADCDTFDCDPAPGTYYVEGSWTFSVARLAGGPEPAGYRLEDWDPATGRWTNPRLVDAPTFSYDAAGATAAKQRLTWRSRRPFVLILR